MPSPDAPNPDGAPRARRFPKALIAILSVAALLRFAWIGVGLPEVEYVDAFKFTGSAAAMARDGDFQPREFQNPALFADVLAILDRILNLESPKAQGLAARFVSALAGIALVWVVWRAARAALSPSASLIAALFAAVSIELVTLSRYPLTDMLLTLFMTAGLGAFIGDDPRPRRSALAGAFLGLAIATKWTGLYLAFFFAVVAAIRIVRSRSLRPPLADLARSAIVALIFFLLFNPHFISRLADYRARFLFEAQIQRYGQIGRVQGGWFDYFVSATPTWEMPWLLTSLLFNMGSVLSAAALGCMRLAGKGRPLHRLAFHALYVALYLLLIVHPGHIKAVRFLAPVIPSLLILSAGFIDAIVSPVHERARPFVFGLACLLLAPPYLNSFDLLAAARKPMTNTLARHWIEVHLAEEPGIFASPFFLDDLQRLPRTPLFLSGVGPRQYRIPGDPRFNAELDPIYSPELIDDLRSQNVKWIVTNSYFDGAFSPVPENLRWFPRSTAAYAAWRRRLTAEGDLVWSVKAIESNRIGPDIEIWSLKPAPIRLASPGAAR